VETVEIPAIAVVVLVVILADDRLIPTFFHFYVVRLPFVAIHVHRTLHGGQLRIAPGKA